MKALQRRRRLLPKEVWAREECAVALVAAGEADPLDALAALIAQSPELAPPGQVAA